MKLKMKWKKYSSAILTKMSYWWFWSLYRSKNILTKFWTIWPLPSMGHARVKWGSNFQNASNDLSCISNYSWGYKDHKKYISLLCVGCMVREILTKGQVGSNFQQHPICMNDISNYSSQLVHSKYIYLSYLSFHFWNKPICLNSDHDCSTWKKYSSADWRLLITRNQ